MEEAATEFQRS